MTITLSLLRPALVLGVLLGPILEGAQEGSVAFEALTGRWFGVSKTKVLNERVAVAFAPDESALVHEIETEKGKGLGEGRIGKRPGRGPHLSKGGWKSFRCLAGGGILLEKGDGWRRWAGDEGWVDAEPPEDAAKGENRKRERRRGGRGGWQSPDGKVKVAVKEGRLVLRGKEGDEQVLASCEEGEVFRDAPVWAEDSSRFAIWKTRDVEERQVHYVESSPKDQLQPKHFTRSYPKPGDEIDTREPWVFFTDERAAIPPKRSLIKDSFQCRNLAWRPDSERLTYEYIERGFGKYRVIEVDTGSGKQRALISEESETFIHVYGNAYRRDLNEGEEILWMSERDGWKHLYLLSGTDGSVKRQLTRGEWVVREVVEVDEEKREILLKVAGCHEGQDPYLIHYARVGIDDGKLVMLTASDGTHDQFKRSAGGEYFTCRWSRVDHAPVVELRKWNDGSLVKVLVEADDDRLREAGWNLPEPFVAKDREEKYDIHGIIILPPDFDPALKYPVVEKIYAGPHGSFVPKSWRPWLAPAHEVAVHGFILVQIDGRGTANRSKEFQEYSYKNLKDAGFPDRIKWMQAAAAKYPQMDLDRVGIFGGSAGGQNALGAMLFHGDFYKAAVADCGCHDNRMDKIWWNEQWMDWPVGPEYADNSNVTHAKNLKGGLMLTVGEVDTNVDPSSTYQVINALIAADKDFDFLPMTGRNHGSGEVRYAQRRRAEFFQRELGGPLKR